MVKHAAQVRGTKRCTRCDQTKPRTEFYALASNRDGRQTRCASCQREMAAERLREDPEGVRLARLKAYVKSKYGLTWENYLALYEAQDGNCAICGDHHEFQITWPGLHVDHDHATGRVRGLLCQGCNIGIGHLRDSIERLHAAIAYLERPITATG